MQTYFKWGSEHNELIKYPNTKDKDKGKTKQNICNKKGEEISEGSMFNKFNPSFITPNLGATSLVCSNKIIGAQISLKSFKVIINIK